MVILKGKLDEDTHEHDGIVHGNMTDLGQAQPGAKISMSSKSAQTERRRIEEAAGSNKTKDKQADKKNKQQKEKEKKEQ